jgi:hypothetical protein
MKETYHILFRKRKENVIFNWVSSEIRIKKKCAYIRKSCSGVSCSVCKYACDGDAEHANWKARDLFALKPN